MNHHITQTIETEKGTAYEIMVPLYECAFYLTFDRAMVPECDGETLPDSACASVSVSDEGSLWVFFDTTRETVSVNTLAHETYHLVARILECIGCPQTQDSEEPAAYLMGWLMQVLHDIIRGEDTWASNER